VELVLRDVRALSFVEVLERRLQHNSVCNDVESDFFEGGDECLHLLVGKDGLGSAVVDHSLFVSAMLENGLHIVAELGVTDEPSSE